METVRNGRRVEVCGLPGDIVGELANGRKVIQNPERTPVGSKYQVVVFDDQVVDGNSWKIELQRTPVGAVVKGDKYAGLGPGVQKAALFGIFADSANEGVVRNTFCALGPSLAVVGSLIDVGVHVVILVAIDGDVGGSRVEGRSIDLADSTPFGKILGSDVDPGLAAVARELDEAIIGACPDQAFGQG